MADQLRALCTRMQLQPCGVAVQGGGGGGGTAPQLTDSAPLEPGKNSLINSSMHAHYQITQPCHRTREVYTSLIKIDLIWYVQISMRMNMDDELVYMPSSNGTAMELQDSTVDDFLPSLHAGSCFTSSSTSSSFRSASLSCSPESPAHVLTAPAATAGCQYPEVSSHVPLAPVVPYGHGQYTNLHVPTPAVQHDTAAISPELPATGVFKRYARHLAPRRPPKPGACGQRMFKTAMSVLAKMHMAMRYSHQYQCHYQEAAAAAAPPPSGNQLQHVISERKRREKLNGSFHALKTVLPPGSKVYTCAYTWIHLYTYVHHASSRAFLYQLMFDSSLTAER